MHFISFLFFFFFNDTATTEIYTLSLHELFRSLDGKPGHAGTSELVDAEHARSLVVVPEIERRIRRRPTEAGALRSEEHTSELQSHSDLVCRLLLEKKKEHK